MLYRILGILVGPFRVAAFRLYVFLFRTPRARIVVQSEDGELLLVRNWGGSRRWNLPGGGVKRGERPVVAAQRELYEETGLDLPLKSFRYIATVYYQYQAPIFVVTIAKRALPIRPHNPREIIALDWFAVDSLPAGLSPLVLLALKELSKAD